MDLEPDLIRKLKAQYPDVDVDTCAGDLSGARNPNALLTSRVREAEKALRGKPTEPPTVSEHAGYWNAVGAWIETGNERDYWDAPSGSITRGIRQLVFLRRRDGINPRETAALILAHRLDGAFPSHEEWAKCPYEAEDGSFLSVTEQWLHCPCRNSAELAVRFLGRGTERPPTASVWAKEDE